MTPAAPHTPVLLGEVLEAMALAPGADDPRASDVSAGDLSVVDATFGAGGYSSAFLKAGARVTAFDRDPGARVYAEPLEARFPNRLRLVSRPFSELEAGLEEVGAAERSLIDGVVFDLGVSSMQVDEAERGFSFMRDGPLDMRMGREGATAADIVNAEAEADLIRLFRLYGEEPAARRIVRVLVRRREETPFTRTLDLADTVERAVGGRRGSPTHPATRVFQALRIAVNDELAELQAGLDAAERVLAPNGRLVVVAFHSLEDRIVKAFLTERSGRTPAGSRHLPPAPGGPAPSFTLLDPRARAPGEAEIAANPRARSAKLRAAVRTEAPSWTAAGRTAA